MSKINEQKYVFFENTYGDTDEDGNKFVTIDGYPLDVNAEGTVIATVFMTPNDDFVTSWHYNDYRTNETVLDLIKDAKNKLKGDN